MIITLTVDMALIIINQLTGWKSDPTASHGTQVLIVYKPPPNISSGILVGVRGIVGQRTAGRRRGLYTGASTQPVRAVLFDCVRVCSLDGWLARIGGSWRKLL